MPLKMAGIAIKTMLMFIMAIKEDMKIFDNAVHLYFIMIPPLDQYIKN